MANQGSEEKEYALGGLVFIIIALYFAATAEDTNLALSVVFALMGSSLFVVSAIERLIKR